MAADFTYAHSSLPCLAPPQETAINIAVSCALVKNPDEVMVLNVDDKSECEWQRPCLFWWLLGCWCAVV